MGLRYLLTTGSYFNLKFVFGELPSKLVPFDEQAFFENPAKLDVLATSLHTGEPVVFSKEKLKSVSVEKALIASSSIPLMAPPVDINGHLFFDGGVADSIPVKYALSKHEKAVAVLTRPRGYRKEKLSNPFLFRFAFRKHPEFLETLLKRNDEYNKTLDFCEQMEREGKLFIIAPSAEFSISRTEKNLERRLALYQHGYQLMKQELQNMESFLSE